MQTVESSNAALTGRIDLDVPARVDPDTATGQGILAMASQDANKKKSSNKPEEQIEKRKPITRRYVRANLIVDLWNEYRKPETSQASKIKIATILAKLTDKRKPQAKPIFG